ncbi:glycosyltransferase family 4 protein [Coleofasciculus chthonoplastes]|uniref:glycosyltransferase family 4 protein n=1 Tax=Coleofasciculus chthonoplastes TaxID=64178 RepID=UPI0032FDD188
MKIILSAYACEPGCGSEEGVGWNTALALARYHQTWVFTRTIFRSTIEAELNSHPAPNLHFIYFDPFSWTEDWRGRQGAVQLHYYLWQIQAYFIANSLHRQIGFDVVHHVTYVKYWSPSFLALLPIPFIWGPVGGGEKAPKAFWADFSLRGKIYETLRDLAQWLGETDPFTRITARRSLVALAATEETAQRLLKLGAKNVQVFSQIGLSKSELVDLAKYGMSNNSPVRFISIGRLLHWKGYHLAIRALARANLPNVEYWLLGDGAEWKRLQTLAEELGVASQVQFLGHLPRQNCINKLGECHIVVHPSLHDSGGWTCIEGMAAGRPIICLDLGGPATHVTEETGIKVPASDLEQAVQGLAEAMTRLVENQELRVRLGEAGQKRVQEVYDWEVKGKIWVQIYKDVLAN